MWDNGALPDLLRIRREKSKQACRIQENLCFLKIQVKPKQLDCQYFCGEGCALVQELAQGCVALPHGRQGRHGLSASSGPGAEARSGGCQCSTAALVKFGTSLLLYQGSRACSGRNRFSCLWYLAGMQESPGPADRTRSTSRKQQDRMCAYCSKVCTLSSRCMASPTTMTLNGSDGEGRGWKEKLASAATFALARRLGHGLTTQEMVRKAQYIPRLARLHMQAESLI